MSEAILNSPKLNPPRKKYNQATVLPDLIIKQQNPVTTEHNPVAAQNNSVAAQNKLVAAQ